MTASSEYDLSARLNKTSHSKGVVLWHLPAFMVDEDPQVPQQALFQSREGTWEESAAFCKLAGKRRHIKKSWEDFNLQR